MARGTTSTTLSFGMVSIPVKLSKASSRSGVSTESLCECGSDDQSYAGDEDGNKVVCNECDGRYSWWNQLPGKGIKTADGGIIEVDKEEVEEAKNEVPVETGQIEKVVGVKEILLQYNISGNYYLIPDSDDFKEQYNVLVQVLNDEQEAMLTYIQNRSNVKRYAIISKGGVLMALELKDKKTLDEDVETDVDDVMVEQGKQLLDSLRADDPELEDVNDHGLKQLVREKTEDADIDEDEIAAEV